MNKYYWFSFSFKGKNQGVCLVETDTVEEAQDKVIELGIVPEYDHIQVFGISEAELPLNILVSPEEIIKLGYELVTSEI
jgi:hypothetical protein